MATLAFVAGVSLAPGCADNVPTASNACPCATGYVCCASGVCASDEASCGTATAALSSAAQGKWVGYIENYTGLASGSDRLEVTLSVSADGQLQGRVVVGEGSPPPLPTAADADKGWPGHFTDRERALPPWLVGPPMDGFPFTARDIKWQARRLRFEAHYAEPWGPWCALQTPNLANANLVSGGYQCGPSIDGYSGPDEWYQCIPGGEQQTPLDCGFMLLCGNAIQPACACTNTACTAASPAPLLDPMRLDLDLQGNEAVGSVAWTGAAQNNVRLIRASR